MRMTLPPADLATYVRSQLDGLFPDGGAGMDDVARFVDAALERVRHCLVRVCAKGFHEADGPRFNHLHTDQYAIFLYYLSNTAFRLAPGHPVADKAYALNKALHGLDAFYEVALPDVFMLVHPVGTVLGRGTYGDYFCAYQNCTVGGNLAGDHPAFGEGVVMYGGSRVIGRCTIGDNVLVAAGASVLDASCPSGQVLFGAQGALGFKPTRWNVRRDIFGEPPR